MTKKEKIQEAYGEYWELVKDVVSEHGWVNRDLLNIDDINDFHTESVFYVDDTLRPKSLQGIENNNGWVKIESEADLPIDKSTQYSTCKEDKVFQSTINCGTVKHWFNIGKITHYQPITKPLKPIY